MITNVTNKLLTAATPYACRPTILFLCTPLRIKESPNVIYQWISVFCGG